MTSDSTETVFEIRYRPNAKLLDHRGEWAEALAGHMSLPKWSILNNRFDVFAEDKTQHCFVSFRNAGMVCLDSPTSNFFSEKAQRFFRQFVKFKDFGDPLHVERIGVRHKLASPFEGTFDELVNRFHTRYVGLSPALIKSFADAHLVDIGAPLNFRDALGHFNTSAGPMLISLGIVTRPFYLLVIEVAVAILTLQAMAINRLAGIDYPLWAPRDHSPSDIASARRP